MTTRAKDTEPPHHREGRNRRTWGFLLGAVLLVALVALGFGWVHGHFNLQDLFTDSVTRGAHALRTRLLALGWKGPLLLILLIGLHSIFIFLPVELPMLAALGVYGPVLGVAYTWSGSMLAAYVGFFLARSVGRPLVTRYAKSQMLDRVNYGVVRFGNLGLILLRFVPVISFNALNYACGLTRISVWSFTWTSALGILLTDALMAFIYRGAINAAWGTVVLCAVGSVLAIGVVWSWHRRTMKG